MTRSNRKRYTSGPEKGETIHSHTSRRFIDGIDTRSLPRESRSGKPSIEFGDYLERANTGEGAAYRAIRSAYGLTEEKIECMEPKEKLYWSSLIAAAASFSVTAAGVETMNLPEIHLVTLYYAADQFGDPNETPDPIRFLQGLAAYAVGERMRAAGPEPERPPIPNDPGAFFAETAAAYTYQPRQ